MASTDKIEAFLAEPRNIVLAGIRRDGRPHRSPNWFYWDGQRLSVSITRGRVKCAIFRRDPRTQLLVDDSVRFRAVLVPATAEIREDIAAELPLPGHPGQARGARTAGRGVSRGPGGGSARAARLHPRPAARGLDVLGPGLTAAAAR